MVIEHTQECEQKTEERYKLIQNWRETWPDHCQDCEGEAVKIDQDRHTGAVDVDWCPSCLEEGICPRCKFQIFPKDRLEDINTAHPNCLVCGWGQGEQYNEGDVCPPPYQECRCFESQED